MTHVALAISPSLRYRYRPGAGSINACHQVHKGSFRSLGIDAAAKIEVTDVPFKGLVQKYLQIFQLFLWGRRSLAIQCIFREYLHGW